MHPLKCSGAPNISQEITLMDITAHPWCLMCSVRACRGGLGPGWTSVRASRRKWLLGSTKDESS